MPERLCLVCAAVLPDQSRRARPAGGRKALYCGSACRQLAYRYRSDPDLAEVLEALRMGRIPNVNLKDKP